MEEVVSSMSSEHTLEKVKIFTLKAAQSKGWVLNPDQDFLESLQEGLLDNLKELGYYQCPCRMSWDQKQKDRDIICPCTYSVADIKEYGHCYCALFLSQEFLDSGKEPGSIPERRPQELFP
jgi:ferredoxin-thioredoxin reductase catalytic subunit